MKRLTYWNEERQRYEINDACMIHSGSITDRLAEYENTKLTPEEIKNLSKVNGNLARANNQLNHNLSAYTNLHMTPVEIFKHMETIELYRNICGGRSPEDIKKALELLYAEEQGLLHKAPMPDGTPIFILNDDEEDFIGGEFKPILETSYLYSHTEFAYGEQGKEWFTSREAAEAALKEDTIKP